MLKPEYELKPIEEPKHPVKTLSFWQGLTGGFISILCLSGLLLYFSPSVTKQVRKSSPDNFTALENSRISAISDRSDSAKISALQRLADSDAKNTEKSLGSLEDRYRARYLLGLESLQRNQPQAALQHLEGLEKQYSVIAPYILLKQVEAYQQLKQPQEAARIAQNIVANYPKSAVIPDLWAVLERHSPEDRADLIDNFPYHPRTQTIIKENIKQDSENWQSLLLLATYERHEDIDAVRDRLVLDYPAKLSQEDWQAIADGYWRSGEHRKAADAYRFSPDSPQNIYRAARGFHRNGNFANAKIAYKKLYSEYYDAQETGKALYYIARLSSADEAIKYLEKAIAQFPEEAPKALLYKARIHEKYGKTQKATLSRKQALENYPDSAAVLNYYWRKARAAAYAGDYNTACKWGKAIATTQSDQSDPKTIFWIGKWANKAGKTDLAKQAFTNLLQIHPQSYYAWRAAVMLGQDVGDFDNLRSLQPNLQFKSHYEPLPIGSETLQELYLLGQYQDAWTQLQSELSNPQQLSVEEQFTEGLLLVKLGQIRPGIQSIWNLAQREFSSDQQRWQALRQKDAYWYGLFPFPYQEIITSHAKQEKINALIPISVMRKESTFDPLIDSRVGAVGLMQIIPRTANWIASQTNNAQYSLTKPEDNIRMGTWYLAQNHQRYQNNSLYAIASYNAGTGNVNRWLRQFSKDPDLFVEQIPFPETKDYVEGVFGNYWNYLRLYDVRYQNK